MKFYQKKGMKKEGKKFMHRKTDVLKYDFSSQNMQVFIKFPLKWLIS